MSILDIDGRIIEIINVIPCSRLLALVETVDERILKVHKDLIVYESKLCKELSEERKDFISEQ